jgi:hypothetical protein
VLPLNSGINVSCPKLVLMFSLPFCAYLTFWWGIGVTRPKRSPVLMLHAKGGEIKAKANGSANHLWISKIVESLCLIKTLLLQNCSLMGEKFRYGKKGSLWYLIKFTFERYLDFQNKCFDREIGKRICFEKINQVVAKVIQIC